MAQSIAESIATLETRIAKDTAAIEKLRVLQAQQERLAGIVEGSTINVRVGRGDDAPVVCGVVKGIKVGENGVTRYKVEHGTGFDAQIAIVTSAQIQ